MDFLKKYQPNTDDELVIIETYTHLQNQIDNYKTISNKYPINFDYLVAAAEYVLNLIKTDDSIAQEIRSIKIREKPE
jgi:hypothetical protein